MKNQNAIYCAVSMLVAGLTLGLLWYALVQNLKPEYVSSSSNIITNKAVPMFLTVSPSSDNPPKLLWSSYRLTGIDSASLTLTNKLGQISTSPFGLSSDIPVEADYNGDGHIDSATLSSTTEHTSTGNYRTWSIAITNPRALASELVRSETTFTRRFGDDRDIALRGDFDGDGRSDIALYNTRYYGWRIAFSSSNFDIAKAEAESSNANIQGGGFRLGWGKQGAIPLVGDFDGDGISDLALWSVESVDGQKEAFVETFYLPKGPNKQRPGRKIALGKESGIPLVGDFDCDGRDDFAVYDAPNLTWTLRMSTAGTKEVRWGIPNAEPLVGNYDEDKCSDLAFYSPYGPICWQFIPSSLLNKNLAKIAWETSVLTRITWCPAGALPTEVVRRRYAFSMLKQN